MTNLDKIRICVSPFSNRVVIARFGKDPNVALDSRDAMSEFLQAIAGYAFDGEMPEKGEQAEVSFGSGDEQFTFIIKRNSDRQKPSPSSGS